MQKPMLAFGCLNQQAGQAVQQHLHQPLAINTPVTAVLDMPAAGYPARQLLAYWLHVQATADAAHVPNECAG